MIIVENLEKYKDNRNHPVLPHGAHHHHLGTHPSRHIHTMSKHKCLKQIRHLLQRFVSCFKNFLKIKFSLAVTL